LERFCISIDSKRTSPKPAWRLREAKARLGEVVRRAIDEGPQHVSVRGAPTAVVLSERDYRQLVAQRSSIVDHMLSGELRHDDLAEAVNDRPSASDQDVTV
jgi:antitoxin Phd